MLSYGFRQLLKRVIRPPKGCDLQVENSCFKAIMRVKEMVKKEKIKSCVFNFITASTKWEYLEDWGGPIPPPRSLKYKINNLNIFAKRHSVLCPKVSLRVLCRKNAEGWQWQRPSTVADCRNRELKNFAETLLRQEKTLGRMPNLTELPLHHNLRIQRWWQWLLV